MLAPIDKLKSRVNDIIQIVVTTACTLQCSNCTQLLPFRKDYTHMSLECFREAVESLREWPGVIGIFGGNPCNHPKFPELCAILCEVIPEQHRRGLWSNDLLKHGEVARDTFYPRGRFNLNAHGIATAAVKMDIFLPSRLIPGSDRRHAEHAAILADYRDFGMTESQWIEAREKCDINQKWSGAIVERAGKPFAYFCEVAAAMDGVLNLNHGIPALPGWWKHDMEAMGFQDQVRKCCDKGCGVPLKMKGHADDAEVYDVSRTWAEAIGEPRGKVGVNVHESLPGVVKENTDYMGARK